jgi:opacity protein-like surface antigen
MKAMVLGAALVAGSATFAAAQAVVPVQWGWGYHDDDDRQAFKEGYKQGKWDARHDRRFDPDDSRYRERDDRQAYRRGYERGFRENSGYRGGDWDRDGDRDRDRDWGRDRDRGGYGYGLNAARQNGYQDGINDGARDRRTGHSNRPTQCDNYKHADRGYIPTYGNKDYYKQAYREAYYNAYEQGYNTGVYQRR